MEEALDDFKGTQRRSVIEDFHNKLPCFLVIVGTML